MADLGEKDKGRYAKALASVMEGEDSSGAPSEGEGLLEEALAPAAPEGGGGEWSPDMGWLMGSVGPFINNNQGIGELLLDKLKESGVNTEGVALAGMVNVLQQFSKELKDINDAVGDNLQRINELSADNENLSQKLKELVSDMGMTKDDGGVPPQDSAGAGAGAPPDLGGAPPADGMGDAAGAMAPPPGDMGGGAPGMDAGAPPDTGAPAGGMAPLPTDLGGGVPGMDAGAPMGDAGGAPPVDGGVLSDGRMKEKVLSDVRMKVRPLVKAAARRARNSSRPASEIVDACNRRF